MATKTSTSTPHLEWISRRVPVWQIWVVVALYVTATNLVFFLGHSLGV